jgi:hypothetical protein
MRAIWLTSVVVYLLTVLPAGFMAMAAFAQRDSDLSGDASRAAIILCVYLFVVPIVLALLRPRRAASEAVE